MSTGPKTQRLREDDADPRASLGERAHLARIGFAPDPRRPPALFELEDGGAPFRIGRSLDPSHEDPFMSSSHAEVVRESGAWVLRDLGSSNGTLVWGERASSARLKDGDVFETGGTFWIFRIGPRSEALPPPPFEGTLATLSPALFALIERMRRVSRTKVPIMLEGSTGTGKEVFAKEIHALSKRPGPFVAINTGAIQKNLVASELFGVEKGAHSTAERSRAGLVRSAEGGTLLLDEIGDMPAEVQVALLRMLQESEVVPVGGERAVKVDVRVVCATHQDLEAQVEAGAFRADLFARVNGCRLALLDLADRREDLGLLIGRFLAKYGAEDLAISSAAYRALLSYSWPLNVRELERAIESAIALVDRDKIELKNLPDALQRIEKTQPKAGDGDGDELATRYREEIERLLRAHDGNVSAVARSMGLSRMQIHRWLKRLAIEPESFRATTRRGG